MHASLSFSAALAATVVATSSSTGVATAAHADGITAARKAYLASLLSQDCGSCHGMTMKGGLGPPLLPHVLADKDDAVLVEAILDGRPGTPMPPWRSELTPEEAAWLVATLKGERQ